MSIPKTLVIGIYLHGYLPVNKNKELINEIIPDGLHVTTINAVAPGVPYISTLEEYENMGEQISNTIKTRKNYDKLTKKQITKLSKYLRNLLVNTNMNQAADILKEHQYLYSRNNINSNLQKFSYQYGNSFKIKTYDSGQIIPNKLFIKFSDGELINPNNFPEHYFNKIILYNFDETDLFEILASVGMDIEQISMAQLMEFLVNLGVQNLIIIDLSCSVFNGETKNLSDRNIRQLRRNILFR